MKMPAITDLRTVRMYVAALLLTLLATVTVSAASEQTAQAAGTSCRTVYVSGSAVTAIRPHMSVPICSNGSRVWQNGNVTPGVNTIGYSMNGITWAGTYNSGGSWMGIGENYSVTIYGGWATFSCASRWIINANGNVTNYDRGC